MTSSGGHIFRVTGLFHMICVIYIVFIVLLYDLCNAHSLSACFFMPYLFLHGQKWRTYLYLVRNDVPICTWSEMAYLFVLGQKWRTYLYLVRNDVPICTWSQMTYLFVPGQKWRTYLYLVRNDVPICTWSEMTYLFVLGQKWRTHFYLVKNDVINMIIYICVCVHRTVVLSTVLWYVKIPKFTVNLLCWD